MVVPRCLAGLIDGRVGNWLGYMGELGLVSDRDGEWVEMEMRMGHGGANKWQVRGGDAGCGWVFAWTEGDEDGVGANNCNEQREWDQ